MTHAPFSRFMLKTLSVLALGSLLACSPAEPPVRPDSASVSVAAPAADVTPAPLNLERYQGQPLRVLDVSEQQLDGAATLVVTFSVPLAEKQAFADVVQLLERSPTGGRSLEQAWELSGDGLELRLRHLPPKTRLELVIHSGLQAATGVQLAEDHKTELTTGAMQAMLGFASRGSLLPVELVEGLPVLARNVSHVDVDFFRVHEQEVPAFVSWHDGGSSLSVWNGDTLQEKASLVYSGRFDLEAEPNVQQRTLLPIRDIKNLREPGVYFAVMRKAGELAYTQPVTLFSLSDIGLSARKSAGGIDFFALSLSSGKSIPGVAIELLDDKGKVLQQGRTDSRGHVRLETAAPVNMVLARKGTHTSFMPLKTSALDLSEFDRIQGPAASELQVFAFSPRDLYRPGETLQINALLRDADGRTLATDAGGQRPLQVEVRMPDGKLHSSFNWTPDTDNGLYQYSLKLTDSAPTGQWQFLIRPGNGDETLYSLQVEDFMPERMALELQGSEQPLAPADPLQVDVQGRFLYGAPAAGSLVQGQLFVRALREAVPALPGYVFGSVSEKLPLDTYDFDERIANTEGKAQLTLDSEWDAVRSPLELIARISLLESAGRPVTRRVSQAVWPAPRLPGIRAHFADGQVDSNSMASFSLLLVNTAGQQQDAEELLVRLVRERRDYYWSYSDNGGWRSRYNEHAYTVQQQSVAVRAGQPLQVELPVQWGSYRIEVEDPATGMISSERFWAGYRWQDSSDDGGVRPDQVRLQLDKPAYAEGDTAVVRVEAPHEGSGYLLLESASGPLWWQEITVPEQGLDVRVPLGQHRRHDLYISALVVRPGQVDARSTAKRAVGVLHVPLQRDARKLQLELSAPEQMRPEQPLQVRIKVREHSGKPARRARVLVSAVDVGVLNITNFQTPDPWQAFFGRKGYGVDQYDLYGQLIDAGTGKLARLRFGGDAALEQGGGRPKSHVRIVSWQSEPLQLDANGEALVAMPMPDFNGQVRLMAQAWNDGSFASAEAHTTVAAPLVAELAMPRFLSVGDSSRMVLELHNLTEQVQDLRVNLSMDTGLRLQQLLPPAVRVEAGQRLLLPLEVQGRAVGTAAIALEIDGLQLPGEQLPALQRSWQLDVRSPWPGQQRRITTLLQPGASWQQADGWLDGLLPDSLHGRLTLSSEPVGNTEQFVRDLYRYPYGCAEQTSSRLLPLLYLSTERLSDLLGEPVTREQHQQRVQDALQHLLSMQRHDGSFGMWSAENEEDYWDTVYATDLLLQAREQGHAVPAERLQQAMQRVLRYVQEGHRIATDYSSAPAHTRLAVQAYAAYVLARYDQIPLGVLRRLYSKASEAQAPLALVHLALALHQAGDGEKAKELLKQASVLKRPADFWVQDYGSSLSEMAWQLRLLQEHGLLHAGELPQRMAALLDAVYERRWQSTQENAAVFMALQAAGMHGSQAWEAGLHTASRQRELSNRQPELILGARELVQPMQLHNRADRPLFQVLAVRGDTERYMPEPDNVLTIERQYFNLDGSEAALDVPSGTLLLAHVRVGASQPVRDALVVDMLPAGFELENQNLAESSVLLEEISSLRKQLQAMEKSDIIMQGWMDDRYVAAVSVGRYSPAHLLYLVRAVTPGSYVMPPLQVQSMYRPEWQASQAAGDQQRLTVRATGR